MDSPQKVIHCRCCNLCEAEFFLCFQRERKGETVSCFPLEIEPGCLVTHIGLLNSVRWSKPDQGVSALENSIVWRYYFDMHDAKSV